MRYTGCVQCAAERERFAQYMDNAIRRLFGMRLKRTGAQAYTETLKQLQGESQGAPGNSCKQQD